MLTRLIAGNMEITNVHTQHVALFAFGIERAKHITQLKPHKILLIPNTLAFVSVL